MKCILKNPFYFAALPLSLMDGLVTFLGQKPTYFENGSHINEASPAYFFLAASPWIFLAGSIVWWVSWYFIFLKLPQRLQLFFSFLFIAGHSWGSTSWIVKFFRDQGMWSVENQAITMLSWGVLVLYLAIMAVWASYCFSIALQRISTLPSSTRTQ